MLQCDTPYDSQIGRNPVGVEYNLWLDEPRVAAALQPWAEIRNPVGVSLTRARVGAAQFKCYKNSKRAESLSPSTPSRQIPST
jgi:hypothetical protein